MPKHTLPRIAYRYLSGRPLDGVARTDGGYLRRGRVRGYASAWSRLPGWQRQAWRLGVPAGLAGWHEAYVMEPAFTGASTAVIAAYAGVRGTRAARQAWRTRRFRAMYIRPVRAALAPALGDAPVRLHVDPSLGTLLTRLAKPMSPAELTVRTWYGQHVEPVLRWLPDRAMRGWWASRQAAGPVARRLSAFRRPVPEDAGPRIELSAAVPYLTPEQRQYVSAVINAKIPAGELVETWLQVGP